MILRERIRTTDVTETSESAEPAGKVIGASGSLIWGMAHELLDGIPKGALLEVAAGGGFLSSELVQKGFDVTGSDLVDQWRFPEIPFICADLDLPLPFDDSAFDVIVFTEGLGYVENLSGTLRELNRALKPEGYLVITMPNVFSLQSRLKFLFSGSYRWFPHPPRNYRMQIGLFRCLSRPHSSDNALFPFGSLRLRYRKISVWGRQGADDSRPLRSDDPTPDKDRTSISREEKDASFCQQFQRPFLHECRSPGKESTKRKVILTSKKVMGSSRANLHLTAVRLNEQFIRIV